MHNPDGPDVLYIRVVSFRGRVAKPGTFPGKWNRRSMRIPMKRGALPSFLIIAGLLLAGLSASAQEGPEAQAPKARRAGATHRAEAKAAAKARAKAAVLAKQVDINSASREALMKVPGVSRDIADKIIAGRPYLTKAHLVTRHILPEGVFFAIKDGLVAKPKAAAK